MFMPDNSVFVKVENPNMAPDRTRNQRLSMEDRLTTFHEVEKTYTEEEALREASRCLGCPRRWCSGECPADMPVPEFIRKVREKDYEGAYELISSASTLPEFCSRLCPQEKQCQSDCTRSIRTEAVGIGKLERFVVEQHYASGAKENTAPATGKKVAIVGSGPSGLSAAVVLARAGHSVTVFEQNALPGGLLRYGIPNMKLEKDTLDRKLRAMEDMGVSFVCGTSADAEMIQDYDAVVLAVGTGSARNIAITGGDGAHGIYKAVDYLSGAESAAGKDVVIIGGGDTGNDCVGTALRQGAKSITQIELLPRVTKEQVVYSPFCQRPGETKFDASQEECLNKYLKDPHIYQATVKSVETDRSGNLISATIVHMAADYDETRRLCMTEIPGSEETIPCGLIVIAAGFLGPKRETAQAFGVETNARSNINGYATNVPKVFACGDCRTGQSLVVKAMVDGRECAKTVLEFLA